MTTLKIVASSNNRARRSLLNRTDKGDKKLENRVALIIKNVRRRGDLAVNDYARRFDGLSEPIEVPMTEVHETAKAVPKAVQKAIRKAGNHIRRVAKRQVPSGWTLSVVPGVTVEQRVTPLTRIGCYVPGGRHPLPSSLLMTAIPAQVAGVSEIIAVCPKIDPSICTAALEAKVSRLFRVGGAHAIAALAYGTKNIPRVDKIVGPGNTYVSTAKALVANDCPIDFFAGPTEIVVVASSGNASWIAADLIAQAEHDPDARSILLTPNVKLAKAVAESVDQLLPEHPDAKPSIKQRGVVMVTENIKEAISLANDLAPEHVVCDREIVAKKITNAGTIFVGSYSAQALGDYATGSNHVLPTSGAARYRGGLSALDFVRINSIQRVTRSGLQRLAPTAISLANAEGLIGHAASVATRLR